MFSKQQYLELTFEQKKELMDFRAKFHTKKAKATAEMKRIPKNGYNKFHDYNYARESDVKDMIREILNENKLSITIDLIGRTETTVQTRNGQATKTDIKMSFVITDAETGYFEEYNHDGVTIDNSDKGIYKAYSNTIKYFLMDQFLIPTGDDVEKESPEVEQPQHNQKQNEKPNPGPKPEQKQTDQSKPTWRLIMDAEDELVKVAGTNKTEIRSKLKDKFGQLGKYKELDDIKASNVLKQLDMWIDQYKHPIG